MLKEIAELENADGNISVKILEVIRRVKPQLIEGMDVFIQGGDDDGEDEEDGELVIEGEPRRETRTVFVDKITNGLLQFIKNIVALTSSFKWSKIFEWKRDEEDFDHSDQELQTLVAAEGAIRQIFNLNFKASSDS